MIALLLAAGTALLPNNLPVSPQTACKQQNLTQASLLRPEDRAGAQVRRLGDMPKANLEKAVMRSVSGCVVPVVVKYEAEGDGRSAGRAE